MSEQGPGEKQVEWGEAMGGTESRVSLLPLHAGLGEVAAQQEKANEETFVRPSLGYLVTVNEKLAGLPDEKAALCMLDINRNLGKNNPEFGSE
ncbi:hypothetical protein UY3_11963 [Chelonia mydas]|uniref:Uncharacterized protein n=1 Tax=Chelonia mydas TaxID=8469 RepID=M7BS30_CHEMY|nr:hypothetical protein UY3_11963 [Chelonia mydas]